MLPTPLRYLLLYGLSSTARRVEAAADEEGRGVDGGGQTHDDGETHHGRDCGDERRQPLQPPAADPAYGDEGQHQSQAEEERAVEFLPGVERTRCPKKTQGRPHRLGREQSDEDLLRAPGACAGRRQHEC